MKVLLAEPRGFCAGVDRAIAIVERALETIGPPIYVRHEVVHNRFVVETGLVAVGTGRYRCIRIIIFNGDFNPAIPVADTTVMEINLDLEISGNIKTPTIVYIENDKVVDVTCGSHV